MKYCIDYQWKRDSPVYAWPDGHEPKLFLLKGEKQDDAKGGWGGRKRTKKATSKKPQKTFEKKDFLSQLNGEDVIFTELGGAADKFCLEALKHSKQIHRIPPFLIKDIKKIQNQEIENNQRQAIDEGIDILFNLVQEHPEKFYLARQIDEQILEIKFLSRAYLTIQRKIRGSTERRFDCITQDLDLIGGTEVFRPYAEWQKVMQVFIPERLKYLEDSLARQIENQLKKLPLAEAIFAPIKGCGRITQALTMGEIGDIRRFQELSNLAAYACYHIKKINGEEKRPRRTGGQTANWNGNLKTAVTYFVDQINRRSGGKSYEPDHPWVQIFLEKKERDKKMHPDFPGYKIQDRAKWWLGRKYLQYVRYGWRRFEGIEDINEAKQLTRLLPES